MSIIQGLGNLALTVVQTGAYIFQYVWGLYRYLEMYPEHRGTLLKEYGDNAQKVNNYKWMVRTGKSVSRG